jgi:hypothetical protein
VLNTMPRSSHPAQLNQIILEAWNVVPDSYIERLYDCCDVLASRYGYSV